VLLYMPLWLKARGACTGVTSQVNVLLVCNSIWLKRACSAGALLTCVLLRRFQPAKRCKWKCTGEPRLQEHSRYLLVVHCHHSGSRVWRSGPSPTLYCSSIQQAFLSCLIPYDSYDKSHALCSTVCLSERAPVHRYRNRPLPRLSRELLWCAQWSSWHYQSLWSALHLRSTGQLTLDRFSTGHKLSWLLSMAFSCSLFSSSNARCQTWLPVLCCICLSSSQGGMLQPPCRQVAGQRTCADSCPLEPPTRLIAAVLLVACLTICRTSNTPKARASRKSKDYIYADTTPVLQSLRDLIQVARTSHSHIVQQMHLFCTEYRTLQACYTSMLSGGHSRNAGLQEATQTFARFAACIPSSSECARFLCQTFTDSNIRNMAGKMSQSCASTCGFRSTCVWRGVSRIRQASSTPEEQHFMNGARTTHLDALQDGECAEDNEAAPSPGPMLRTAAGSL
jgi:hypothetical protein